MRQHDLLKTNIPSPYEVSAVRIVKSVEHWPNILEIADSNTTSTKRFLSRCFPCPGHAGKYCPGGVITTVLFLASLQIGAAENYME